VNKWSDSSILKDFPNPCCKHTHTIKTSDFTFHGYPSQPDYAKLTIEMIPDEKVMELKSVKQYLFQFRTKHISYERILDVMFEDFISVYSPFYLKISIETSPRGGLTSKLEKST